MGGPGLMIGLTGGIASGKSTVARLLAARGALVIDSDELAREVVEPGTQGLARIVERFSTGVLRPDGTLDRPVLGRLVFADPDARRDLETIIHPAVRARAAELAAAAPQGSVVVQMIPLLVETGQQDAFDLVLVVDVDPAVQVERVRARDGLDEDAARSRIRAQVGRATRLAAADVVLVNDGTPADLERDVDEFWRERVTPLLARKTSTDPQQSGP